MVGRLSKGVDLNVMKDMYSMAMWTDSSFLYELDWGGDNHPALHGPNLFNFVCGAVYLCQR